MALGGIGFAVVVRTGTWIGLPAVALSSACTYDTIVLAGDAGRDAGRDDVASEAGADLQHWMPWNYRQTLTANSAPAGKN